MPSPTSEALIKNAIRAAQATGLPIFRVEVTRAGVVVHTAPEGDGPCDERAEIERRLGASSCAT